MNNLMNILLMGAQKEGENPMISFLPLLLIVLVFYLFMIRPQMKKQKDLRKFRETIKNGDKVVTSGGIYGKIVEVREQAVILEVENKMKLKIDKSAVLKDASGIMEKK